VVCRLGTDFAAIDLEADQDGIFRLAPDPGVSLDAGEPVAYILSPGEVLPGEEAPPAAAVQAPPRAVARSKRARSSPLADVLPAAGAADIEAAPDPSESLPWDAFPAGDEPPAEVTPAPKPLLLFPRIVSEIKEEAAVSAEEEPDAAPDALPERVEAATTEARRSAWGCYRASDFNPEWLLDAAEGQDHSPTNRRPLPGFNIRSLALGRVPAPA
jgi:hypothetical protein